MNSSMTEANQCVEDGWDESKARACASGTVMYLKAFKIVEHEWVYIRKPPISRDNEDRYKIDGCLKEIETKIEDCARTPRTCGQGMDELKAKYKNKFFAVYRD